MVDAAGSTCPTQASSGTAVRHSTSRPASTPDDLEAAERCCRAREPPIEGEERARSGHGREREVEGIRCPQRGAFAENEEQPLGFAVGRFGAIDAEELAAGQITEEPLMEAPRLQ